jgi:hypothetical protein
MDQSVPLLRLMERLRESQARLKTVQAKLPPALRERVRGGPVDEEGWALLADNAAVAAKLRHFMPLLEAAMVAEGFAPVPVRVRISAAR